jgi:hypothetical protein
MSPVDFNGHQQCLQQAMDCLLSGDEEGALRLLDRLDRGIGLQDTSRFLRAQALWMLSRRRAGVGSARMLRRAALDVLRIVSVDSGGVVKQMRRNLAQALCEHAIRTLQSHSHDWLQSSKTLRKLRNSALPCVGLACRLVDDDPNVTACRKLLVQLVARFEELDGLADGGVDSPLMRSE